MGIIINPRMKGHWQFKERENNKRCSKVLDLVIIRSPTVVMSKSFLIATGEDGEGWEGEELRVKGSRMGLLFSKKEFDKPTNKEEEASSQNMRSESKSANTQRCNF